MLIYFLPGILLLGLITSYEDIRYGKIRNKWVIYSLIYAFMINLVLIFSAYLNDSLNIVYIYELLTNISFSVAVGFGLWYYNIWSAGDGKLFIAFSSLIPLSVYQIGHQNWIPSITLVINIFFTSGLAMFIMMLRNIRKVKKRDIKQFLRDFFDIRKLGKTVLILFSFYWVTQNLLNLIGITDRMIIFLFNILILSNLRNKFEKLAYIIAIIRLFLDHSIYSLGFVKSFLFLVLVWKLAISFIRTVFFELSYKTFSKKIEASKLKPGMILPDMYTHTKRLNEQEIRKLRKEDRRVEVVSINTKSYLKQRKRLNNYPKYIDPEPEGITKEDIKKLKKIGFKDLRVSETIPFALFIFIGVIATLLLKGNILILIKNLLF